MLHFFYKTSLLALNVYDNAVCGKQLRIVKSLLQKTSIQQLVLEYVFYCPETIHVPCNILRYHLVWPFRFVDFSVCDRFRLWPCQLVAD